MTTERGGLEPLLEILRLSNGPPVPVPATGDRWVELEISYVHNAAHCDGDVDMIVGSLETFRHSPAFTTIRPRCARCGWLQTTKVYGE